MQKHKENLFLEKFSLLNSQEHSEDIKWSSSSSSEYETTSCNTKFPNVNKSENRKRKRKKKVPKNTSNLDITIIETSSDNKNHVFREKSPIFQPKCLKTSIKEIPSSPILKRNNPPHILDSPIVSHPRDLKQKSPILILKGKSPKCTGKVRKKLYQESCGLESHDRGEKGNVCQEKEKIIDSKLEQCGKGLDEVDRNVKIKVENVEEENNSLEVQLLNCKNILNNSESSLKAKLNLMNKVKSYFDSQFSSDTTSQNISDTPTPEDSANKSDEKEIIEILTCKTQSISSMIPIKHENSTNSDSSTYFEKNTKKTKYKKGGLAYRLHTLLKKQTAHVSLWQHERFLAGNSNFVIPKGEHVVFYIQKVDFKYGCYLIQAINVKDDKYCILINSMYVNNNISIESVFKLYEPYRILDFDNDYKIIVNVCKFECIVLEK